MWTRRSIVSLPAALPLIDTRKKRSASHLRGGPRASYSFALDGLYIQNKKSRFAEKDSVVYSLSANVDGAKTSIGPCSVPGQWGKGPVLLQPVPLEIPEYQIAGAKDVKFGIAMFNVGSGDTRLIQSATDVAAGIVGYGADSLVPGLGDIVQFVYSQFFSGFLFTSCDGITVIYVFHMAGVDLVNMFPNGSATVTSGEIDDNGSNYQSACQQSNYEFRYSLSYNSDLLPHPGGPHHR